MVEKTISRRELQERINRGAIVEYEKRPMIIEQFGDLIETLKTMIAAQEARAVADLSRSQTQLEVIASLQTLIKKDAGVAKTPPLDLAPLYQVLAEMKESNHHEPVDYDFTMIRHGSGLSPVAKVEVRVVRPTLN